MLDIDQTMLKAAESIATADSILITAGAGIGVDSGLPDFRGNQGFWNIHPVYAKQRLTFADLANPMWFKREPERAWGFYGYRYNLYQSTIPHPGFGLLKKWMSKTPNSGFVYTSNVDGHFQKSGFPIDQIYECHGSIHFLQCADNCSEHIWPAGAITLDLDADQLLAKGHLPACPYCGGVARPNILMFDDGNWLSARSDLQRFAYQQWRERMVNKRLVKIEIGAGISIGGIRYASQSLPGTLIRINPRDAEGPKGTLSIGMSALAALCRINQLLDTIFLP